MTALLETIIAHCTECGDCLLWRGAVNSNGIPMLRRAGSRKLHPLRRVVLQEVGTYVDGQLATNTCGRALCVAPEHALGVTRRRLTLLAIARTAYHKSPVRNARISAAVRAKRGRFADPAVRQAIIDSPLPQRALAKQHGVSQNTIGDLKNGVTYKVYGSPWAGLGAMAA